MGPEFAELLAKLDPAERPLSTIRARMSAGRLLTAIDELDLAQPVVADGDRTAPRYCVSVLVVLTDRRLLVGQLKRKLRRKSEVWALGEVPLDRIEAIEPRRIDKAGWSARPYIFLALVSLALLFVLLDLEGRLPDVLFWSLLIVVGLVGQGAAYGMVAGDYGSAEDHNLVLEVRLPNGNCIPLTLYGRRDRDSLLRAFRMAFPAASVPDDARPFP